MMTAPCGGAKGIQSQAATEADVSVDRWEAWLEYLLPPPLPPPAKTDFLMLDRPSFMDAVFGDDAP